MIYVMSDIHGNLRRFESVMKQINLQPDDTLYILGDVIDRWPYGIKILRRIMKMPNVKMLLGNHELMMLEALDENGYVSKNAIGRFGRKIDIWYNNGGMVTHNYIKHLSIPMRREIIEYLKSLPVSYDFDFHGMHYKLVHAAPPEWYETSDRYYSNEKEYAVWERRYPAYGNTETYTVIFGHTPTIHFQSENPMEIHYEEFAIGIDCGAGGAEYVPVQRKRKGRLACLRLDDLNEFYSEEFYDVPPEERGAKKKKHKNNE